MIAQSGPKRASDEKSRDVEATAAMMKKEGKKWKPRQVGEDENIPNWGIRGRREAEKEPWASIMFQDKLR